MAALTGPHLVERDEDLEDDQQHDDELQPQAAFGIDEIGQRLGRVADDVELAMERRGALLQLIFVLEAGIKTLQIRAVPENIRLFLDRDAARYPLPDQKRVADMFENLAPARRAAALFGKVTGE